MFFFFVCGEKTFRSALPGYDGVVCQCHRCGNWNARVLKTRPFFTICWIPLIPLFIRGDKDVHCDTCGWDQALSNRPDVQQMVGRGPAEPVPQGHAKGQAQGPPAAYGAMPGQAPLRHS